MNINPYESPSEEYEEEATAESENKEKTWLTMAGHGLLAGMVYGACAGALLGVFSFLVETLVRVLHFLDVGWNPAEIFTSGIGSLVSHLFILVFAFGLVGTIGGVFYGFVLGASVKAVGKNRPKLYRAICAAAAVALGGFLGRWVSASTWGNFTFETPLSKLGFLCSCIFIFTGGSLYFSKLIADIAWKEKVGSSKTSKKSPEQSS